MLNFTELMFLGILVYKKQCGIFILDFVFLQGSEGCDRVLVLAKPTYSEILI